MDKNKLNIILTSLTNYELIHNEYNYNILIFIIIIQCHNIFDLIAINDFPGLGKKPKYRCSWVASLEYENEHTCAGAFINGNLVVTAASCIIGKMSDWQVSKKRHNLDLTADKEKSSHFMVKSQTIHPEYVPTTKAYDVSIWELDAPQGPNTPIKLDDGWGVGDHYSNLQREVQISIIRESKCSPLYENLDNFSQFCVAYPQGAASYCQYEPGSPITILKNGEQVLVGITSSDTCIKNEKSGIFIKTGAFSKFINNLRKGDENQYYNRSLKDVYEVILGLN